MSSDRNESAKGNILIVDDAPENIRLLSSMLQQANYVPKAVEGAITMLKISRTMPLDLVLIDIDRIGAQGYEVCRQLKATPETRDIPVIFLSSLNDIADKLRGFEAGCVDYITKPFQPPEVLIRVKNQIEQRQLRKQLEAQNRLLQAEIINHIAALEALQKAKYELELLNRVDGLTMLYDRHYFDEYLEGNWRQMQREETVVSLIICNLDIFHLYKEIYGHDQGDNCLQRFAQALVKAVKRPGDIACRYGDDEFSIILPKTDASGAITVAKQIQRELQIMAIAHSKSPSSYLTVSIGVSTAQPTQQESPQSLLDTSQLALYQAKQEGRDRIIFKMVISPELPSS